MWYDGKGPVSPNIQLTMQRLFTTDTVAAQYFFDPWAGANKPDSRIVRTSFLLGEAGAKNSGEIMDFMKSIRCVCVCVCVSLGVRLRVQAGRALTVCALKTVPFLHSQNELSFIRR